MNNIFYSDFYVDRKGKLSNLPVQDADLDRQDIPRKAKEILQSKQNMSKQKIKGKVNKKRKMKKAAGLYFIYQINECVYLDISNKV